MGRLEGRSPGLCCAWARPTSLFDKLTGTRRPGNGVVSRSPEEVRALLLGLTGVQEPDTIREGGSEGTCLVAEWRRTEPGRRSVWGTSWTEHTLTVRMRIVAESREVRALDLYSQIRYVAGRRVGAKYTRGPVHSTSRHYTGGKDTESGTFTETFRFDTNEMKAPLRKAVLEAGWTWRGVVFGRL